MANHDAVRRRTSRVATALGGMAAAGALCLSSAAAFAWGDEGHEVIALIADHFLEPLVRERAQAMLAGDDSELTARDLAHEATWADKYRDSDRSSTRVRYDATRNWHFVDLELDGPDADRACSGRPQLPPGTQASAGPARDCVIDKIDQFTAELKDPRTDAPERRLALQYLLHFVGDVHQPLHAADDHDEGGNRKIATVPGMRRNNLHHDWDSEFVARLGADEAEIAQRLIAGIGEAQRRRWSAGTPADWAMESFLTAKSHAYGLLPAPDRPNHYELTAAYVADATAVTAEQLSKAGVRLAYLLNQSLR
ncbi:MAG: S1/P1 nuclease [Steroidobacteraceae bacterium]